MTTEEAYERLGLEPRHEFKLAVMRRNLSEERVAVLGAEVAIDQVERATGKTTYDVINCLCVAVASDEGITMQCFGSSRAHALHLSQDAAALARRLGFSVHRMHVDMLAVWEGEGPRPEPCGRVEFDHG